MVKIINCDKLGSVTDIENITADNALAGAIKAMKKCTKWRFKKKYNPNQNRRRGIWKCVVSANSSIYYWFKL